MIEDLTKEMKEAAGNLDFERAMQLRDINFWIRKWIILSFLFNIQILTKIPNI